MIIPTKTINFSESLLGLGAYILSELTTPKSVDELWEAYQAERKKKAYLAKQSFEKMVMALIFLYSIDSIVECQGVIKKSV